jgi:hypothetical protein
MRGLRAYGRTLVLETLLVLLGFVFARWLAVPGLLGAALAVWGFGLVRSLRALVPDSPAPSPGRSSDDAFEAARSRALALLEQEP